MHTLRSIMFTSLFLALATLCITGWLGAATGRPDRSRSPLAALREAELSGAG